MSTREGTDLDSEGASARTARIARDLTKAAAQFGFRAQTEYPIPGGRLDVVWLRNSPIPGTEGELPIVAFEIESSWRSRKHIKGDMVNLQDACALVGVIVLLGDGPEVESTNRRSTHTRAQGRLAPAAGGYRDRCGDPAR